MVRSSSSLFFGTCHGWGFAGVSASRKVSPTPRVLCVLLSVVTCQKFFVFLFAKSYSYNVGIPMREPRSADATATAAIRGQLNERQWHDVRVAARKSCATRASR